MKSPPLGLGVPRSAVLRPSRRSVPRESATRSTPFSSASGAAAGVPLAPPALEPPWRRRSAPRPARWRLARVRRGESTVCALAPNSCSPAAPSHGSRVARTILRRSQNWMARRRRSFSFGFCMCHSPRPTSTLSRCDISTPPTVPPRTPPQCRRTRRSTSRSSRQAQPCVISGRDAQRLAPSPRPPSLPPRSSALC